jgi:hypothetical protein
MDDWGYFVQIINDSTDRLYYLNLNYCAISGNDSSRIFRSLAQYDGVKDLKYLLYAGNEVIDCDGLLQVLKVCDLRMLDLSGYSAAADHFLRAINRFSPPSLTSLILTDSQ